MHKLKLYGCNLLTTVLICSQSGALSAPSSLPAVVHAGHLLDVRDWIGARSEYQKLERLYPKDPQYPYRVSITELNLRKFSEAAASAERATALDAKFVPAYCLEAGALVVEKKYQRALIAAEKAVALAPGEKDVWIARGTCLEHMGKTADAVKDYDKAVRLAPDSVFVYKSRQNCYWLMNEKQKSILDCDRAARLDPKDAEIFVIRGRHLVQMAQFEKALADYKRAEELHYKPLSDVYKNIACCYSNLHELPEAVAYFSKRLQILPGDISALGGRAACYLELGESEKAAADTKKWLETKSSDAHALCMMGKVYQQQGKYVDALKMLNAALSKKHDLWEAVLVRAAVEYTLNAPARAIVDYTQVIEQQAHPDFHLFCARAQCYLSSAGDSSRALPDINKALTMAPLDPRPQVLYALYLLPRKPSDAEQRIKALVAKYPKDLDAWRARLHIADAMRDSTGEEEALRVLVKLEPKNTDAKTRLANMAARKLDNSIRQFPSVGASSEQSIAALTRAVQSNPKEAEPLVVRGAFYLKNLDAESAIADFTKAIQLDPKLSYAYVRRGFAYRSLEQFDKAFSDFEKAKQINPSDVEPILESARLHRALKQMEPSLHDYDRLVELKPMAVVALIERSAVELSLKKNDLALRDAQKALTLKAGHQEYKTRGDAYFACGDYRKALEDYSASITLKPDDLKVYGQRALCYQKLGENGLAAKDTAKIRNFNNEIFENAPFRKK